MSAPVDEAEVENWMAAVNASASGLPQGIYRAYARLAKAWRSARAERDAAVARAEKAEARADKLEPVFRAAQALCEGYGQPGDDEAVEDLRRALWEAARPAPSGCGHPYRGKSLTDDTWHCGHCGGVVPAPAGEGPLSPGEAPTMPPGPDELGAVADVAPRPAWQVEVLRKIDEKEKGKAK